MRRKINDAQLRELVTARRTKGAAFMHDYETYQRLLAEVRKELSGMSRTDILAEFPEYTYDVEI